MNQKLATSPGTLYLVATPIGNLQDMTFRAVETLKMVDFILAEDTRHAKTLLTAFQIQKPVRSFHAHNEEGLAPAILERIQQGAHVALISDAGTPLIQDPGFPLVKLAANANIPIVPLPGACAFITALCASGVACDRFLFAGFLPAKASARQAQLEALKTQANTLIFYESTHRILDTLETIRTVFGEDYAFVLAKELTKTFEQFLRGNVATMLTFFHADPAHKKGEFVLILPPVADKIETSEDEKLLSVLLKALPLKQAVIVAEQLSPSPRNALYQLALKIKS
jgi:16S rRNA (cytidine1402-2'-O)-methyltransferase